MTFRHDDKAPIHECWACPAEVRDLLAQCSNLVGAYERGEYDRVATKMADLKATLDARRPAVDAHFAAIGQPRTVKPSVALQPPPTCDPAGMNIGDRVRVFQDPHGRYPLPIPQRPLVGQIVGTNAMDRSCSVLFDHYGTLHVFACDLEQCVPVFGKATRLSVGDSVRWSASEDAVPARSDGSVYLGVILAISNIGKDCEVLRSDGVRVHMRTSALTKHEIPTGG